MYIRYSHKIGEIKFTSQVGNGLYCILQYEETGLEVSQFD